MDEEHHDPERVGRDCHLWCDPDGVVNLFGHFPWVCTLGYPCQIPAGFCSGANSAGQLRAERNRVSNVKRDGTMKAPPNHTRRMLCVLVGQVLLIAALFVWNDLFPSWVNQIIVITLIFFPPLAYLTVLAQSSVRQEWRWLFRELYLFALLIPPAMKHLFSFRTIVSLARLVRSMKPYPESLDGWVTLCLFPFKTYIVVAYPFTYISMKLFLLFSPMRREFWGLGEIIVEGYLLSLVILLLGALLQALICRAGRATQTLGIFLLGIIILFVLFGRL